MHLHRLCSASDVYDATTTAYLSKYARSRKYVSALQSTLSRHRTFVPSLTSHSLSLSLPFNCSPCFLSIFLLSLSFSNAFLLFIILRHILVVIAPHAVISRSISILRALSPFSLRFQTPQLSVCLSTSISRARSNLSQTSGNCQYRGILSSVYLLTHMRLLCECGLRPQYCVRVVQSYRMMDIQEIFADTSWILND